MSKLFQTVDDRNLWKFIISELKPKGKLLTPFNIISVPIIILGIVLIIIRFWKGIGSITNLNQEFPWGLWIGFDVSYIKKVLRNSSITPPENSVNNTTKQGKQKDNKK